MIKFEKEKGDYNDYLILMDKSIIGRIITSNIKDKFFIGLKFYEILYLDSLKEVILYAKNIDEEQPVVVGKMEYRCRFNKFYVYSNQDYLGFVCEDSNRFYYSSFGYVSTAQVESIIKFMSKISNFTYGWKKVGF